MAIGLTENDGVAALAGTVGFVVMLATMGVVARCSASSPRRIMGIPSIETGVFGGIIVGLIAAALFNRYYRIQLPPYLGLLRRQALRAHRHRLRRDRRRARCWLRLAADRHRDRRFSHWAAHGQPALAFTIYGVVERALIPFGLHHIWNVPFFFEIGSFTDPATGQVVHGDITRFFAGDPTAGILPAATCSRCGACPRRRSRCGTRRAPRTQPRSAASWSPRR